MACMECVRCGWMGNDSPCPECGAHCEWDELPVSLESDGEEVEDGEEEEYPEDDEDYDR